MSNRSDPFLESIAKLHSGVVSLPAEIPRPQSLISPQSEMELEAWRTREAEVRERLDGCVLSWLSSDHWPSDLDGEGGFLILLRMQFAREWLEVAQGLASTVLPTPELLEELLIPVWSDYFVERHLERLHYRMCEFQAGLDHRSK